MLVIFFLNQCPLLILINVFFFSKCVLLFGGGYAVTHRLTNSRLRAQCSSLHVYVKVVVLEYKKKETFDLRHVKQLPLRCLVY